jgi:hypothetical protein
MLTILKDIGLKKNPFKNSITELMLIMMYEYTIYIHTFTFKFP